MILYGGGSGGDIMVDTLEKILRLQDFQTIPLIMITLSVAVIIIEWHER